MVNPAPRAPSQKVQLAASQLVKLRHAEKFLNLKTTFAQSRITNSLTPDELMEVVALVRAAEENGGAR
jgi:hypothetical protein